MHIPHSRSDPDTTLENETLSLSVDRRGRIVSLVNKITGTELIAYPAAAKAWRLIIPSGRHTVDFVNGAEQEPAITVEGDSSAQRLELSYETLNIRGEQVPIKARFVFSLKDDSKDIQATVQIENGATHPIDEVEFPIIGGIGALPDQGGGKTLNLVMANDSGRIVHDCLHKGLPITGMESHYFARRHETAIISATTGQWADGKDGRWTDLWSDREGLYLAYHAQIHQVAGGNVFIKLEKYPKETPNEGAHLYPESTPRWIRASGLQIPQIKPGAAWTSLPMTVLPHEGSWHRGADRYSEWRHTVLPPMASTPSWMDNFVGWTEILGKTYLGEVFHDYARCAEKVIADAEVTGLDLVFYYGHTRIGAEGADFDHSPAPDLGGEPGFRKMVDRLHERGIRIVLLDHLHRFVNRDLPEYEALQLERYAVRNADGQVRAERKWGKETVLSCMFLEGPTPCWTEMCPACRSWRDHYLRHITQLIDLGVDGVELDLLSCGGQCYSADHGHAVGADMTDVRLEFIREVRRHVKELNPDFVLFGETLTPDSRSVVDGFYPNGRYFHESGQIYRYVFPEIRQQVVHVSNYAYDQVNKALMLGLGVDTEIWGLRTTALEGCPELAQYIGQITRFRRKHGDVLIRGHFRDTQGGRVRGSGVLYSVIEGPDQSRALILRNTTAQVQTVQADFTGETKSSRHKLWRPFGKERKVTLPVRMRLKPYEAAVILELDRE